MSIHAILFEVKCITAALIIYIDILACSYALFDTDGRQIPQTLVTKIGEVFDDMLKEVGICSLDVVLLLIFEFCKLLSCFNLQADKLRQENINDVSIAEAIAMVLERRPDLRSDGFYANSNDLCFQ